MDVLVMLGSKSDLEKAKGCIEILKEFGIQHKLVVASAHRTPDLVDKYLKEAEDSGAKVVIGMAGMAAHLPGVLASKTLLPVIGVPLTSKNLSGKDALYSIVQMPAGFPVATVAIDGSRNAALLAVHILSISDAKLKNGLIKYRTEMKAAVIKANEEL